jgi:hypothetical protein
MAEEELCSLGDIAIAVSRGRGGEKKLGEEGVERAPGAEPF